MKALQRHIIFAAIGGVIFFILLGLASLHALNEWQNSYRLQLVSSQAKYVQQVFDKILAATQYQHQLLLTQSSENSELTPISADFSFCYGGNLHSVCEKLPTQEQLAQLNISQQQLQQQIARLADIKPAQSVVGIVEFAQGNPAILATSKNAAGYFLQGYVLPHDIAGFTVEPFDISVHNNAFVSIDLLNADKKWAVPMQVTGFLNVVTMGLVLLCYSLYQIYANANSAQ